MVAAAAASTASTERSEKMEEEDGLIRTVESLKGRLQAEREASRAAKKDALFMDNKLKELEHELRIQIKARKREEKRLHYLKKKLESLNIVYTPSGNSEDSEQSSNSITSGNNCGESYCISSTASTGFIDFPEEHDLVALNKSAGNNCSKTLVLGNVEEPEDKGNSSGLVKKSEESNSDDHSLESFSVVEIRNSNREDEDYVENTMALVPAVMPEDRESASAPSKEVIKDTSENVREILDTLKQIRERLQTTIGDRRRHMIRVG